MRVLLQTNKQRKLTEQEALRLNRLIVDWEQAQIASNEAALAREITTRVGSFRALNENEVL